MKNQYNFNNFFKKNGYCVIPLFDTKTFTTLKKIVHDKINLSLNKIGKVKKLSDLKKYHNLKLNENEHLFMVKNSSRFIKLNSKVINKIKKNKKFTNLLHNYWGHSNMLIRWVGALEKKNSLKNNATAFRVARPKPCKDVGEFIMICRSEGKKCQIKIKKHWLQYGVRLRAFLRGIH